MTTEWITAIAAAFSAILVPGALLLAVGQWREMAKQTNRSVLAIRSTIYQSLSDQLQQIGLVFVERPQLRKYFYDKTPPPQNEPEATQCRALAVIFIDFFDMVAVQAKSIPEQDAAVWHAYFRDMLESSAVLRDYWRDNAEWYSDDLRRVLQTAETNGA